MSLNWKKFPIYGIYFAWLQYKFSMTLLMSGFMSPDGQYVRILEGSNNPAQNELILKNLLNLSGKSFKWRLGYCEFIWIFCLVLTPLESRGLIRELGCAQMYVTQMRKNHKIERVEVDMAHIKWGLSMIPSIIWIRFPIQISYFKSFSNLEIHFSPKSAGHMTSCFLISDTFSMSNLKV